MKIKFYISNRFFSELELLNFREKFGHNINEISYSSSKEIDFSNKDEKTFLFKNGYPKILARFFS